MFHRPPLSVSAGLVRLNRLLHGCLPTIYQFHNMRLIRIYPVEAMLRVSMKRAKHSLGPLGLDWKKLQFYGKRSAAYPCVITSDRMSTYRNAFFRPTTSLPPSIPFQSIRWVAGSKLSIILFRNAPPSYVFLHSAF